MQCLAEHMAQQRGQKAWWYVQLPSVLLLLPGWAFLSAPLQHHVLANRAYSRRPGVAPAWFPHVWRPIRPCACRRFLYVLLPWSGPAPSRVEREVAPRSAEPKVGPEWRRAQGKVREMQRLQKTSALEAAL